MKGFKHEGDGFLGTCTTQNSKPNEGHTEAGKNYPRHIMVRARVNPFELYMLAVLDERRLNG